MPQNLELTPKNHPYEILLGQRPLSKFTNYEKAIKVDLIDHSDPVKSRHGLYNFVKATWSDDGFESTRASEEEIDYSIGEMLAGRSLGLGLEKIHFTFRVRGITRIDTHQIVRQRVGVTFSQQCSGDRFWHHQNILVEPSITTDFKVYEDWIKTTLSCKNTYASSIDSGRVSIQAARSILPHNIETFIFMEINLMTLLFFHHKRINDGSQTWQINVIADQMANLAIEKFPQLAEAFEKNKTKFKLQEETSKSRTNMFSSALYPPVPDNFDWHPRDFLYPKIKNEMHKVRDHSIDFADRFFFGVEEITETEYDFARAAYNVLDRFIHQNHFSNDKIAYLGRYVTGMLEHRFNGKYDNYDGLTNPEDFTEKFLTDHLRFHSIENM